jgi:hypothetical protein
MENAEDMDFAEIAANAVDGYELRSRDDQFTRSIQTPLATRLGE